MTKLGFRAVYGSLTVLVGVPFFLGVVVNDLPPSMRKLWPFFLVSLVLLVFSQLYIEWRERSVSKADGHLGRIADELARSVYKQWSGQANARRIDTPARLLVAWRISEERPFDTWQEVCQLALQWRKDSRWADVSAGTPGDHQGTSELDELFAKIPTGRLVVLGKPGAGKTVLLVKLLLRLLERQDRKIDWADRVRKDQIIPFLTSLSGWTPKDDLGEWLADRLVAEHPSLRAPERLGQGRPTLAEALLRENLILPILDGFDEIPGAMRVIALEKINKALRPAMDTPLAMVISGRSDEFRRAAKDASLKTSVVPGAAVVLLEDVSPEAAIDFLGKAGRRRWANVFEELGTETPVGKVLRTPLMLSLAHAVYNWHPRGHQGTLPSPDDLLGYPSPLAVRRHLLDEFVPAAYRDQPEMAGPAVRALGYIAAYLERGEGDPVRLLTAGAAELVGSAGPESKKISFAWWRLRRVAAPVIGLTIGIPGAAAVGIVAAVIPHLGVGLGLGMITGLVACTITGMISSRSWRLPTSPNGVGVGVVCGFVGALLGAAPTGIILHLTGYSSSPVPGLMGSLGAGIGPGVNGGFRRGIWAAATGGVVCALTAGLAPGLAAGVVDGVGAWLAIALTISGSEPREPSQGIRRMGWSKAGYLVGAVVGLAIGTAVAVAKGPVPGLIAGTVTALVGGFGAGLEGIPADFTLAEAAASPDELLERDRGVFWLVAVIGGGAFGLGAGLGVRLEVGLAGALAVGLTAASLQASWLPFVITRWWCAATGRLPRRLMLFLDEAYKRDILRQVGGMYLFRHIELQRRLAEQYLANSQPKKKINHST